MTTPPNDRAQPQATRNAELLERARDIVRTAARSIPPADFGSTLAINTMAAAIVPLLTEQASHDALRERVRALAAEWEGEANKYTANDYAVSKRTAATRLRALAEVPQ
jgi:uncharacterized protein YukE